VASQPAAASADPAGAKAVARAVVATKAIRSYGFRAQQLLVGGTTPQRTALAGRAIRPSSIVYTVTVGKATQQVVRVGGRTYLRVPPAPWKALAKAGPAVDPVASLLTLLNHLQQPHLQGSLLTGAVPASALSEAHLAPPGASAGAAAPAEFRLDAHGRASSVALKLSFQAGARRLELSETTSFYGFNSAPAIKPPGVIKHK
jgi:hypothetical protein